jgi:hypothetical protein
MHFSTFLEKNGLESQKNTNSEEKKDEKKLQVYHHMLSLGRIVPLVYFGLVIRTFGLWSRSREDA